MPLEQAHAVLAARRGQLQTRLGEILRDWPSLLTLEIGCGHGHFLVDYARTHPAEHCLGIDILPERLARAERKARRMQLRNVAFVRAEADLLLETMPDDYRWKNIFVLFPDPWPKRRHHKNRLMRDSFLGKLAGRTSPSSRLYFRTDYAPYHEEVLASLRAHPVWRLADEPWSFEAVTVFQERAERYYSCVAAPAADAPPQGSG